MTTNEFALTPGVYATRMAYMGIWRLALPLGVALLAILFCALWRWEFIIVALALLLIIFPTVLMLTYFTMAAKPMAIAAVYTQTVSLTPNGIMRTFYPDERYNDVPEPQTFQLDSVSQVEISDKYMILKIISNGTVLIIIPQHAMSQQVRENFISTLQQFGIVFA